MPDTTAQFTYNNIVRAVSKLNGIPPKKLVVHLHDRADSGVNGKNRDIELKGDVGIYKAIDEGMWHGSCWVVHSDLFNAHKYCKLQCLCDLSTDRPIEINNERISTKKLYQALSRTFNLNELRFWITTKARFQEHGEDEIREMLSDPGRSLLDILKTDYADDDADLYEEAIRVLSYQCFLDDTRFDKQLFADSLVSVYGGVRKFMKDCLKCNNVISTPEGFIVESYD